MYLSPDFMTGPEKLCPPKLLLHRWPKRLRWARSRPACCLPGRCCLWSWASLTGPESESTEFESTESRASELKKKAAAARQAELPASAQAESAASAGSVACQGSASAE